MALGKSPILGAALLILSAAVLWLSATQILRFVRFGELPELAYRLDAGEVVSRASIVALVPKATEVREAHICQGVFLKSSFSVLLAAVDMENRDTGYETWSQAVERADAFALHALGCLPTNGGFWLRLAMLRQAVGEQPDELVQLTTNSQLYAPSEGGVIAGRYALYNRVTDRSLDLMSEVVTSDIKVICSRSGDPIRDKLAAPSPSISRILKQVSPQCSLAGIGS